MLHFGRFADILNIANVAFERKVEIMVKISAKGTKFIGDEGETIDVTYKVGNCKLKDKDLGTLLRLQEVCEEHPTETIDCRTVAVKKRNPAVLQNNAGIIDD